MKIVALVPTGKPHEYTEASVLYAGGGYYFSIAKFVSGKHCVSHAYILQKRISNASSLDEAVALVKSVYGI